MNNINEICGEEFQILNKLKNLSQEIIEESKQEEFNFEKNKKMIKSLADCLTS